MSATLFLVGGGRNPYIDQIDADVDCWRRTGSLCAFRFWCWHAEDVGRTHGHHLQCLGKNRACLAQRNFFPFALFADDACVNVERGKIDKRNVGDSRDFSATLFQHRIAKAGCCRFVTSSFSQRHNRLWWRVGEG